MTPLSVALLGYGAAGRTIHAPLLRATRDLAVRCIVTADPGRRAEAAADFPEARLSERADDLWEQRDTFDLVVVATPSGTHTGLALAAMQAGCAAVVVEKPLATTAGEARSLVDEASARRTLLVPFHNRRWDSDQQTLRKLLAEGVLGDVYRYESRFERWRPRPNRHAWRETMPAARGGGVLLDLGVHVVDQALSLFGPATGVFGEVAARRGGADDDAFIALHHRSGTRSHLWVSALSAAPGPRLRVLGSSAAFVMEHLDGQEEALRRGVDPGSDTFGRELPERWGRLVRGDVAQPVPSQPGRWGDFYPAVVQALRSGSAPPVEAGDAVATLEVLDAVRVIGAGPVRRA